MFFASAFLDLSLLKADECLSCFFHMVYSRPRSFGPTTGTFIPCLSWQFAPSQEAAPLNFIPSFNICSRGLGACSSVATSECARNAWLIANRQSDAHKNTLQGISIGNERNAHLFRELRDMNSS